MNTSVEDQGNSVFVAEGFVIPFGTNLAQYEDIELNRKELMDYVFTQFSENNFNSRSSIPEYLPYSPDNPNWLSTFLGTGSSQTIKTGVDLSGKITATADGGDKIGAFLVYLAKPPLQDVR